MRQFHALSILACFLRFSHGLICLQQDNPQDPLSKVQINCNPIVPTVSRANIISSKASRNGTSNSSMLSFQGLRSPASSIISGQALPAPVAGQNVTNMFRFDLGCPLDDDQGRCANVKQSMDEAGQLISNVVDLSAVIVVNVTMLSFCQEQGLCSEFSDIFSLAAAAPARTIPLIDNDNITRLYPQAVVKQFSESLESVPAYADYDINLEINSDGIFYFPHSKTAIKSSETDFLFIMLHELMHGMGFTSSYEDYFHTASASTITPNVLLESSAGTVTFDGFIEYAFDRYFTFRNGSYLSDIIRTLNVQVTNDLQNRSFSSSTELSAFITSNAEFGAVSTNLAAQFTSAHSITFASPTFYVTNFLTLETSIAPFSSGSSISHLAADLYANTGDFLMRAYCAKGITLQQVLSNAKQNGARNTNLYGALGPGLRGVLGALGYRVRGGLPEQSLTVGTNATTAITQAAKTSAAEKRTIIRRILISCITSLTTVVVITN